MFCGLINRARVRHAENGRAEVCLSHCSHIRKILVLECLLCSNAFSRIVCEKFVKKVNEFLWSIGE